MGQAAGGAGREVGCAGGHPRGHGELGRAGRAAGLPLASLRVMVVPAPPPLLPVASPAPVHPCVWDPAGSTRVTLLRAPAPAEPPPASPVGEGVGPRERPLTPSSVCVPDSRAPRTRISRFCPHPLLHPLSAPKDSSKQMLISLRAPALPRPLSLEQGPRSLTHHLLRPPAVGGRGAAI